MKNSDMKELARIVNKASWMFLILSLIFIIFQICRTFVN
jgi:capsular polysaccharide biosynthesis protein